jgi:hypothetical protein
MAVRRSSRAPTVSHSKAMKGDPSWRQALAWVAKAARTAASAGRKAITESVVISVTPEPNMLQCNMAGKGLHLCPPPEWPTLGATVPRRFP